MMYSENQNAPVIADEMNVELATVEQELAKAREEIADLKSQIMWLERSYE